MYCENKDLGTILITSQFYCDERGWFMETWHRARYDQLNLGDFCQDNVSYSKKGVLRGLHLQSPNGQGKLVSVLQGQVFDVAVDLVSGKWVSVVLDDVKKQQFYIPAGLAHGFLVLSDEALFQYKCTNVYDQGSEHTLIWNDPDVGIDWPLTDPIVSDKDLQGLTRKCIKDKIYA